MEQFSPLLQNEWERLDKALVAHAGEFSRSYLQSLVERGLVNYWGYNTLGFFCPEPRYAAEGADGRAVRDEFRQMVRRLQQDGNQKPQEAAQAWAMVAQSYAGLQRFADAEAVLKVLLTENNEHAAALILYARCLAERGELGEAEAVLGAVKAMNTNRRWPVPARS